MFRLKSRVAISRRSDSLLLLRTNPSRRIMFGAVAALLLVAFFMNADFQSDFERPSIGGTIFYAILTLTCVAVAGSSTSATFDGERREIRFARTFFSLPLARDQVESSAVQAVVIQGLKFLKESEQPQTGLLNTRFRGYISRRNAYYKLYLDFAESRRLLEDSTDLADLEAAAQQIAGFLNVDYRREEIGPHH